MLLVPNDVPISVFEKMTDDPRLEDSEEPQLVTPKYDAWTLPPPLMMDSTDLSTEDTQPPAESIQHEAGQSWQHWQQKSM